MAATLMDILSWSTSISIFIIYPITLAYSCYKFHQHRNKQYFIHRNIPLLIAVISSFTIFVYIGVFPGYLAFAHDITFIQNSNLQWSITFLISYATTIISFIVTSLRYFDLAIKIIHSQNTKKWKSLLNPEHNKNDFISKHYQTLSNPKYQLLSGLAFFIIGYGIIIVNFFLTGMDMMKIYIGPVTLITMIGIFVSACLHKIVPFADFWYIRAELLLMCSGFIAIIPVLLVAIFVNLTMMEQAALLYASSGTGLILICFLHTQMYLFTGVSSTAGIMVVCLFPIFWNERRDKKIMKKSKTESHVQKLYGLMQDKNGYEALMDHLEHEFSVENLLFLTEMIQFRDFLKAKYVYLSDKDALKLFENDDIKLPENAPKSEIFINANDKCLDPMEIFVSLYQKYIEKYKSDLEVNISYGLNIRLTKHYQSILQQLDESESEVHTGDDEKDQDGNDTPPTNDTPLGMASLSDHTRETLQQLMNETLGDNQDNGIDDGRKGNVSPRTVEIALEIPSLMSVPTNSGNCKCENDEKKLFIESWNGLVLAAREVTSILHHSAQRCAYKIV